MAGCYGNYSEDRYFERMLHRYLDEACEDDPAAEARWEARREELLDDSEAIE